MKEGIVLVAHGSRDPEWSRPFERIAASLAQKLPACSVGLAYGQGGHVREDLPRLVRESPRPGLTLSLAKAIGDEPRVIEAIACAISEAR